ncbi:Formin-H Diaphanous-related formin dia2 [Collichthys lucidus]|uniref:Formin-H Diaphanous-related formin dia2 n=1 Tax=Collichthys lucidus TaxID=240159 RepID=A0A4U5UNR5_COLLU|nr:Formin-H Diaphanous-related formin dia2 [Collichthys lucidus]
MERDAWVEAIAKLCSDWKRKSMGENMFVETKVLRNISIAEDAEDTDTELETSSENIKFNYPPCDYENLEPTPSGGAQLPTGDTDPSNPPVDQPVPKPRSIKKAAGPDIKRGALPPVPTSPSVVALSSPTASPQPSPSHYDLPSSVKVPEPPTCVPALPVVPVPPPMPPPFPSKLRTNSKKARTRAFHWDVVGSDKIAKSFWKQESTRRIEIDTSRLYEQFAVKDLGTFGAVEPSNTQNIMLNPKVAHNFNIFLKSFPVQPGELKDKLFIINEEDGGMSDEHITSLRRYVPTLEDVEMYKSHKGPVTELHIVDQYMMEIKCPLALWELVPEHERDGLTMWSDLFEVSRRLKGRLGSSANRFKMCNIPYLSTQLDLLLTLRELPNSMSDLQPLINQQIRMCTQLNNCRSFLSMLEYLLTIGNYLNENARKEKAKGFRLSSLTKVSQLRGRDRKFTLLHALVEQIMLHEPCLANFTQELAEFETVPGASIKGLTAEVDGNSKVCAMTETHQEFLVLFSTPQMAIEKYNTDLSALTKTCEEMKKLYSVILVKFGEPAEQDSQELFGMICQFVDGFKRTHAEMI